MKKIILCCLAAMLFCTGLRAQTVAGVTFFEGTFEQALVQAKKENKLIFMDAYATWCAPCKAMSRNVFPNKEVGDFYNANFVNLKVNWETEQGKKLQAKYPIRAYPALLFINADGKLVAKEEGYYDAQELIKLGETVLKKVQN